MKVTFLTGEYPPMQGGIADHTAYLAQYLEPLQVESSVLIAQRWQDADSSSTAFSSSANVYPLLSNWGWRCWREIPHFLEQYQPDILHIQYQAAAFDLGGWVNWVPWYLKKCGVTTRIITTFHDLRVPYIWPKAGSFRWRSMLTLARYSDAVICTNREDLTTLQQTFGSETNDSPVLTLIPLGSNVEPQPPTDFVRSAWREKYQISSDALLLAYFGFLNESKGGEELIESLALLREQGIDAHLLFIGGDIGHADPTNVAYAQRVQALIEQYHLADDIHRTGYVTLPEVSAHLLAADVVVMPYRDGVSFRRTTLIAALRHGCPVISTFPSQANLIPEIVPGENMLLVPPRDPESLAEAIASLTTEPKLRQQLARGAKSLGDLFEWETIAHQTHDLYRRIYS